MNHFRGGRNTKLRGYFSYDNIIGNSNKLTTKINSPKNTALFSTTLYNNSSRESIYKNKPKNAMKKRQYSLNNIGASNVSYGERLYQKGLAIRQRTKMKIENIKKDMLKTEMENCTFKPNTLKVVSITKYKHFPRNFFPPNNNNSSKTINTTVNNNAKIIHTNQNKNRVYVTTSVNTKDTQKNYATESNIITNVNVNQKTNLSKNRSNSSVSFHVGKLSNQSTGTKKSNHINLRKKPSKKDLILHSIKLYNDSKTLKMKKKRQIEEFFNKYYPFRPRISKSQEAVPARSFISPSSSQKNSLKITPITDFFYRLQHWVNQHTEKVRKAEQNSLYDPKTGLRLFSPQLTSKSKISEIYSSTQDFSNKLYYDAINRIAEKESIDAKQSELIYKMANSTFFSPRSREIIDNLLRKIFNKIFSCFTINGEFIDRNNINLETVDIKVVEVLFPLLNELDNNCGSLKEEDFFNSCMKLYKTLSIFEKNMLIEWYFSQLKKEAAINKQISNNFTFKPKINKSNQKELTKVSNDFQSHNTNSKTSSGNNISAINPNVNIKKDDSCTFRPKQKIESYANNTQKIKKI